MDEGDLVNEAITEVKDRVNRDASSLHLDSRWTDYERRIFECGALMGATQMYNLNIQDWVVNG